MVFYAQPTSTLISGRPSSRDSAHYKYMRIYIYIYIYIYVHICIVAVCVIIKSRSLSASIYCPFASPALDGWDSVIVCKQRYSQTRSDAICTTSHAVCSAIPPPPLQSCCFFPVTRVCPMTVPLMRHDSSHDVLRCRARNSVVLYYVLPVFFFYVSK